MTITHDAKGNLTQDNTGLTSTFDFDNMLKQVIVSPSATRGTEGTHTYEYDALGRRVAKTVTPTATGVSTTTVFIRAGQQILAEYEGTPASVAAASSPARKYLYCTTGYLDEPIALIDATGTPGGEATYYYHRDRSYNIIGLTNTSGVIVELYTYTLHGERQVHNASWTTLATSAYANHRGFQGLYHDQETGLIENRARTLDPTTGRFTQRDPLGYPDGLNTYAAYHCMFYKLDPFGMSITTGLQIRETVRNALRAPTLRIAFYGYDPLSRRGKAQGYGLIDVGIPNTQTFTSTDIDGARTKIIQHFDISGDGKLSKDDCPPFDLRIIGYSWGGASALRLTHEFSDFNYQDPPGTYMFNIKIGTIDPVDILRARFYTYELPQNNIDDFAYPDGLTPEDVRRMNRRPGRKRGKHLVSTFTRAGAVTFGVNYYETEGGAGLPAVSFPGKSVAGMDINEDVTQGLFIDIPNMWGGINSLQIAPALLEGFEHTDIVEKYAPRVRNMVFN